MNTDTALVATPDGVTISLDRYGRGMRPTAIVICPGFFQSKDTKTFQRMAMRLARGRDVITMDFRGHGRSSGLYTFSALEGADLEAALHWAIVRYRRLGVIGFSLGGAVAIATVSRFRDTVRSLIAVSAPCLFEEIEFKWWTPEAMRTGAQGLEAGAGCRPGNLFMKKPKPIELVAQLSPTPIAFLHGTRDVIVGVQHSRRLYEAAAEPKQLEIVEDGSHAEALFRDDPDGFCQRVEAWWAKTLPSEEA